MPLFISFFLLMPVITQQSDEISFTYEGNVIDRIHREEFLILLDRHFIDEEKLLDFINEMEEKVYTEPKDAYIDDYGDIITELHGHQLHKEKFLTTLWNHFHRTGSTTIEVPVRPLYPKVDSELLSTIQAKKISSYSTYFNSRNQPRTHNIQLATRAINNFVVLPGEVFSFNQVVGKRTIDRGYLPAPIIVKGEVTEGIGGGICQVSSTLFNAVDKVGVEIIERFSHSKRVPYVPPNRDATVSWYGPDFVFKNRHHQPLLIQAKALHGQMIVEIYSSEDFQIISKKHIPSAPKNWLQEVLTNESD